MDEVMHICIKIKNKNVLFALQSTANTAEHHAAEGTALTHEGKHI